MNNISDYVRDAMKSATPPIAAALGIAPTFWMQMIKSRQQIGDSTRVSFKEGALGGVRVAPLVGAIVGTQMICQEGVSTHVFKGAEDLSATVGSATIVGILSAPLLAMYNAKTQGLSMRGALSVLSKGQVAMIAIQEGAFVAGIAGSAPLTAVSKEVFGDNLAVVKTSQYVSAAAGGGLGHFANTALTRWQASLPMSFRAAPKGLVMRAHAIGCFNLIYQTAKEQMFKYLD